MLALIQRLSEFQKPGNTGFVFTGGGVMNRKKTFSFLPVIGVAQNLSIAYTPVTNADYAKFLQATARTAPQGWNNGRIPVGKENHPVVNMSYNDAVAYCQWLTKNDRSATYRLPTESEKEQLPSQNFRKRFRLRSR